MFFNKWQINLTLNNYDIYGFCFEFVLIWFVFSQVYCFFSPQWKSTPFTHNFMNPCSSVTIKSIESNVFVSFAELRN